MATWLTIMLLVLIVAGVFVFWLEAKLAEFVAEIFKGGADKWHDY